MVKKIICVSLFAAVILLLFTGCFIKKEPEPEADSKIDYSSFSEYDAKEAALSYLKEKYNEEFSVVEGVFMSSDMFGGGNAWYDIYVVKKKNENKDNPRKYNLKISYEYDGSYHVFMDDVINEYYEQLYYDFAAPIIAEQMGNIPYELVVEAVNKDILSSSALPDSFDNEKCEISKDDFSFEIFIPGSYDSEKIPSICNDIKNSIKEENYKKASIVMLSDNQFDELVASDDKYWKCIVDNYFVNNKYYEVE